MTVVLTRESNGLFKQAMAEFHAYPQRLFDPTLTAYERWLQTHCQTEFPSVDPFTVTIAGDRYGQLCYLESLTKQLLTMLGQGDARLVDPVNPTAPLHAGVIVTVRELVRLTANTDPNVTVEVLARPN